MLEIKTKGIEGAQNFLKALGKLGSVIKAADLNSKDRHDGDRTNAEILEYLKDGGRDFISSDDELDKAISKAMTASLQDSFDKMTAAMMAKNPKGLASSMAAKAFLAAMDAAKAVITDRIESGKGAEGTSVAPISESYADAKQRKYGFVEPAGKASGQLLDNLAPGPRNTRLRK